MQQALRRFSDETRIGFALQGGGTYGAFTMGALSVLLESGIIPDAISATSSGAVNAAIVTYALERGTPELAQAMLKDFWYNHIPFASLNSYSRTFNILSYEPQDQWPNIPQAIIQSGQWMLGLSNMMGLSSPVPQMLRDNIAAFIPDWSFIQNSQIRLFINSVAKDSSGRFGHVVFDNKAACPEAIAASGALREFGGFHHNGLQFYDGAYARNPSLEPLINAGITDLIVITLSHRPAHILEGAQKDFYDATMVTDGIHKRLCQINKAGQLRIHTIELPIEPHWNETSRLNTDPDFLKMLEEAGKNAAREFLWKNTCHIGRCTTYRSENNLSHAA